MRGYRPGGEISDLTAGNERKEVILFIWRVVAALAILMVGGLLIYMFGAGFLVATG